MTSLPGHSFHHALSSIGHYLTQSKIILENSSHIKSAKNLVPRLTPNNLLLEHYNRFMHRDFRHDQSLIVRNIFKRVAILRIIFYYLGGSSKIEPVSLKEIFVNWPDVSIILFKNGRKSFSGKDKATPILDAAEDVMRASGYHGWRLEDIAGVCGLPKNSIQAYFSSKSALGSAVAKRYTDRFVDALGDPEDPGAMRAPALKHFIEIYRHALTVDGLMCMCCTLGWEIGFLPKQIQVETRRFFHRNIDWLERSLRWTASNGSAPGEIYHDQAFQILCSLKGAILISTALGELESFDRFGEKILECYG